MKKLLFLILLAGIGFAALWSCNRQVSTAADLPFNPYVEAFSAGRISRHNTVQVMFSQDVDSVKMAATNWKKAAKISPNIEGAFSFENSRTFVFRPKDAFERNTTYTVSLDISEWFDAAKGDDARFAFKFTIMPLLVRGHLKSLDPVKGSDKLYDVSAVIFTSDTESPETVEALVKFSEKTEVVWEHSPDGKKHEVTMKNIEAGNAERNYTVSVTSNKLGVSQDNIFAYNIPGLDEFRVFDTTFTSDPERYIEVTFSKNLDKRQEMRGLIYIVDNSSDIVTVDGNKVRLYPDAERKGIVKVRIDATVRSEGGLAFGDTQDVEISIPADVPSVSFIGSGTIIPQSTRLTVPFQAIYLRGVVVRVIKIQERNIGPFLQINQLDQSNDMMRVGRLVARKTIFFDDESNDLSQLNTFALDLREMIEPEPGAIYRIELDANKSLSAYPGHDSELSKEQILARDNEKFLTEVSRYDETEHYYYYYDDYSYDYYYYEDYSPDSNYFWYGVNAERNVLATNLGLMAMAGATNEMTVQVHNLLTTQPERGVEVTVRNFQHGDMGTGITDDKGQVKIAYSSGKPFYVIASKDKQRSYLRVDGGSALSLSTFDVSGEVVQKGIKGFIYGDRGVWRPGDTLYLSFMLNDCAETLPESHPVTMELINPLGQVYLKKTTSQGVLGTYSFEMPTDPDAETGSWIANVTVGGVKFTKRLRIETIKPNRLKIDIKTGDRTLLRGEPMEAPVHVEWMTGATARDLAFDIQGTFHSTPTAFANYNDYTFDDPAKTFSSEESSILSGVTDGNGDGTIQASFDIGTSAPGMLMGNFVARVYEESGDFSIDAFRMQYSPYKNYVGVRSPQKDKNQLNTGANHSYDVVSVDYTGKAAPNAELEITVHKVYWYWWWSSDRNRLANYISDSYNKPVSTFNVTTDGNGKGSFTLNFPDKDWGTYYISVTDRFGNHSTGVMNYFDWPYLYGRRDADGNPAANILQFKTDKDTYAPGEKISITIPSTTGARAVVNVLNGSRVLTIHEFECGDKETTLRIDVTDEMQPNAYIYISLLQPHGNTENDLPIRLYGVVPVTVSSPRSRLLPVIGVADEIRPESRYEVAVSEKDGREMSYTLAIVDEGLLDLTRFRTPEPWSVFNAREALGVSLWDHYNYVVGAYGGRIEQYFSIGGDDELSGSGPKAIVNRFKPVVHFEGPFLLKAGEKRRHKLDMPNYNGRVRVMVVAGDGKAYGNSEKSVFVRKPVMILGTLPRVIGVFEEMDVPAAVFVTKEGIGNVQVAIQTSDNIEVVGEKSKTLNFGRIEDKLATFRVRVKGNPGAAKVTLTAVAQSEKASYETDIEIRSVRRPVTRVTDFTLEAGKSWSENLGLPGADGTNRLVLEMSDVPPLNLTSRLSYLLGYPHGCLEQITSKAFPQLYVKEFASLTSAQERSIEDAVKSVIDRYRSYMMSDGSLSYWPSGGYYNSWAMSYAIHFMLEAEGKGYNVPSNLKSNALSGLRHQARNWSPSKDYYAYSNEYTQAYRLYVLALGKMPEIGAMNRMKEDAGLSGMTRWMLAAAYARIGRDDVASSLIEQTKDFDVAYSQYDLTYGSNLRDKAVRLIAVCLLDKGQDAAALVKEISGSMSSINWYSTQTTAFSLMGISEYMARYKTSENMSLSYKVDGKGDKVETTKNVWSEMLLEKAGAAASLDVTNTGKATLFGRVVAEGTPNQGDEEAYEHGIRMTVEYRDGNGKSVQTSEMEQGTNFKAVVTVSNPSGQSYRNLAITQIFPAGWEILNTRFLNEGATDEKTPGLSYQDIRDDRVYSYIDYLPSGRHVAFSIDLSSIYRGRFYLPPVYCEAMYDYLVRANTTGTYIEIK